MAPAVRLAELEEDMQIIHKRFFLQFFCHVNRFLIFYFPHVIRLERLRQKLDLQGLKDVVYIVINDQGAQAQRLHPMLAKKLSENITLYQQDEQQPNVWQTLSGTKDDFLIYDRCGRLTHHISLPNTIIGLGHVETAIRDSYCKPLCGNCTFMSTEPPEECTADVQPDADAPPEEDTDHHHDHGHGAHHGHGHQRENHGSHPHGSGHGGDNNHGQHHGSHGGHGGGNNHGQHHGGDGALGHDRDHHQGRGHDNSHGHGQQGDNHPRGFGHGHHDHDHHHGDHGGDHQGARQQGQERDVGVPHQLNLEQLAMQMQQMQQMP
ncbi:selenoprotein Pa isoform X2 [Labrus mixtus]|uniref:selenoprotein Pa isoform X2 n=1 Tax=Labrus mixtus TaxID=508554 RepID=UPI0029BFD575|nr:selenoprotein Pa isoform X2 [Labrus mixtus]